MLKLINLKGPTTMEIIIALVVLAAVVVIAFVLDAIGSAWSR